MSFTSSKSNIKTNKVWDDWTVVFSECVNSIDDFIVSLNVCIDEELEDVLNFIEDAEHVTLAIGQDDFHIHTVHNVTLGASSIEIFPDFVGLAISLVHVEKVYNVSGGLDGILVGNGKGESNEFVHYWVQVSHVVFHPISETLFVDDVVSMFSVETSDETVVQVVGNLIYEFNIVKDFLLEESTAWNGRND